jgi:hypothetical protein
MKSVITYQVDLLSRYSLYFITECFITFRLNNFALWWCTNDVVKGVSEFKKTSLLRWVYVVLNVFIYKFGRIKKRQFIEMLEKLLLLKFFTDISKIELISKTYTHPSCLATTKLIYNNDCLLLYIILVSIFTCKP